jgi:hypothetical protein
MIVYLLSHPLLISLGLIVVGCAFVAAAWLTTDEMWSIWYWIDRLRGISGELDMHAVQIAGVNRGRYLVFGLVLVLLGLAWPWMASWK